MQKMIIGSLGALMLLTTACAVTREEALEELETAGYEPESAECIMASIERQGFEAADLADPISAEVEAAIGVGVEECITAADLAGVGENISEDELRNSVIGDLVGQGIEQAQAECIVSEVEGAGYTMIDLAQAGLEGQTEGGVIDVMTAATIACTQ